MASYLDLRVLGRFVVALTLAAGGLAATNALAQTVAPAPEQQTPADLLTVEGLIGDAVSLSNQKYPDIEQAIRRFKNGDVEGAREYLDLALQKFDKLPPVDVTLAKMYFIARNVDAGKFLLESAITAHPEDPEAYLLLADQAFAEGRTAEAHALFDRANEMTKKFDANAKRKRKFEIRVLAGLAAVEQRRQHWKEAEAHLRKWIEIDPDGPQTPAAHQRLGDVLFRQKKAAEAFDQFTQARKLDPDADNPNIRMGMLYVGDNDKEKAKKAFEDAYKQEPTNENTARAYADYLIQQDDLAQAQKVAAALKQKSPNSINALLMDGLIAKMRGDRKGAEDVLMKALSIDPANAGATNLLALLLAESNNVVDKEKALSYAQVNAQRFPNSSQAQITYAWVLYQLNRIKEGNEALQRGAQAGQLNADSAYLVARILVAQGRKDNARQALEQMMKQMGGGAFIYRKEAAALLKELTAAGAQAPPPTESDSGKAAPSATDAGK